MPIEKIDDTQATTMASTGREGLAVTLITESNARKAPKKPNIKIESSTTKPPALKPSPT